MPPGTMYCACSARARRCGPGSPAEIRRTRAGRAPPVPAIGQPGRHPIRCAVDDEFLEGVLRDGQPDLAASRTGSFVHQVKSRSVAGPWLRKYRRTNSPSASSRSVGGVSEPIRRATPRPDRCPASARGTAIDPGAADRAGADRAGRSWRCPPVSKNSNNSALVARPPSLEQRRRRPPRARAKVGFVQPELAVSPGQRLQRSGGRELEHPADVLGGDQVQRAAHRPGPDDLAAGKAASTSTGSSPAPAVPTDHFAPGRSCACIASIHRTTSTGRRELAALDPLGRQSAPPARSSAGCGRHPTMVAQTYRQPPNSQPQTAGRNIPRIDSNAARRGRHRAAVVDDPRTVRLSARGRSRRLKGWSPGHVPGTVMDVTEYPAGFFPVERDLRHPLARRHVLTVDHVRPRAGHPPQCLGWWAQESRPTGCRNSAGSSAAPGGSV